MFFKTKKIIVLISLVISIIVNCTLGYWVYVLKQQQLEFHKNFTHSPTAIKVATALTTVKHLLEGSVKEDLKKYNIDLQTVFSPGKFEQTYELLANKEVDAKYDTHVHHLNIANKRLRLPDKQTLTLVQTGYLAKFGLYAKKDSELRNLEDIKKYQNSLKILIPEDNFQKSLSFYLLQQLGILKLKQTPGIDVQSKFKLKPEDFQIEQEYGNLQIEYSYGNLYSLKNQFLGGDYHLCTHYPTLMGLEDFSCLGIVKKPERNEDPIYSYTISLVARENNKDTLAMQILKNVLKQESIINEAQEGIFKNNCYMISSENIDPLTKYIKEHYLSKTHSVPLS